MKILIPVIFLTLSLSLFSQKNVTGRYRNNFGSSILLNADSSFKYTQRIHMTRSWTSGTWSMKKDTVYCSMIPIHDTIDYKNAVGSNTQKLVLSADELPERMTKAQYDAAPLQSGGQNTWRYPEKLFFRKGRLYEVISGRLIRKKQKGFMTKKKRHPWYVRING